MQSDNICECVKFVVNFMGYGHAQNLNRWRYKIVRKVLNDTSCVFIVWMMDTWDNFVIVQGYVVLMIAKKFIIDCFINLVMLCQVVIVEESE